MVATNCKSTEREQSDSWEKDEKTKKNKPVRDITLSKKCDLITKKIREADGVLDEDESPYIEVSLEQLENMLRLYDEQGSYLGNDDKETTKVKLSSLSILLASPDLKKLYDQAGEDQLAEIVRKITEEELQAEKQDRYERRKYQKKYDDARSKDRKKKREMDPMLSVKDDFRRLASGIMEDDTEEDLEEKKEKQKDCARGNGSHSKTTGRFQKKGAKDGSWSKYFSSKGKSGCKGGRAKLSGGSEQFTKATNCGRKSPDGSTKNQYKCSEPKKKYAESIED